MAKRSRDSLSFVSKDDDRLKPFTGIPVLADYQKSFQKVFNPVNLQESKHLFRLQETEAFLDPRSIQLVIKGRIQKVNADGNLVNVPPLSRMETIQVTHLCLKFFT